jgi:hypothetical protein
MLSPWTCTLLCVQTCAGVVDKLSCGVCVVGSDIVAGVGGNLWLQVYGILFIGGKSVSG